MENRKVKVKVTHLTKKFGDLLVLNDVSFDVYDGEFLCIVGPTGCGKTTFLNSLTHLYEPTARQHSARRRRDRSAQAQHRLHLSGILRHGVAHRPRKRPLRSGHQGCDYKNIDEKVNNALDLVGLTPFADYYPKQLSASMLQRVVIARAFATQPDLLLMDEPYGQLDINLRFKLEDEVIRLCKQTKTTVLFITHNIEEAVYLGDRILVLTNKPTSIKEIVPNDAPHPRDIAAPDFIEMRNRITNLIKWW